MSQVLAYDAEGKPTVIAEGIRGNDLVVRHDGAIYVYTARRRRQPQPGLVYQPSR